LEQLHFKTLWLAAPQTPRGNFDILDRVIHQNVRLSDVSVSDILEADQLKIFFHILNHVSARDTSAQVETHAD